MLDYIIVGNGLSAYLLAFELYFSGKSIKLIGQSRIGEASRISSGLINPVTGRRFVKTWNYDLLIEHLVPFYSNLENHFQSKFLYKHDLILQLESIEQENNWLLRLNDPEYGKYCSLLSKPFISNYKLDPNKAYGRIIDVYRVDIPSIMSAIQHVLMKNNFLMNEWFDYMSIQIETNQIKYKDNVASNIIFCEGVFVQNNPYFSYLPIIKLKGERTLFSRQDEHQEIFSAQYSAIPLNDHYWIGSNYSLEDLNENITEIETNAQSSFAKQYLGSKSILLNQDFGFRPSTRDRRPIVGVHPEYSQIYILNGMGTKAASLLPYSINLLTRHLTDSESIPESLSPKRFVKKGYQFN